MLYENLSYLWILFQNAILIDIAHTFVTDVKIYIAIFVSFFQALNTSVRCMEMPFTSCRNSQGLQSA